MSLIIVFAISSDKKILTGAIRNANDYLNNRESKEGCRDWHGFILRSFRGRNCAVTMKMTCAVTMKTTRSHDEVAQSLSEIIALSRGERIAQS